MTVCVVMAFTCAFTFQLQKTTDNLSLSLSLNLARHQHQTHPRLCHDRASWLSALDISEPYTLPNHHGTSKWASEGGD